MTTKTKSKRIFYFDALRATAILCVIIIHLTDSLQRRMLHDPTAFYSIIGFWELFAHNAFRIGVPLFLMLSGALSLGRDWEIKNFLGKRLPRIIKPFVFWSIVGSSFLIIATFFYPKIGFIKDFGIFSILKTFINTFLYKSAGFHVYWFFWMILGTYFAMPIFNKWLFNSELKEAEYFLVLWIISTIFEYTLMMECPIKLSYFTSPMGFVVLGYYLRHTKRRIFNNKYIAALLIIIPALLMVIYGYYVLDSTLFFRFDRYSIFMLVEATGVFCLFKCSDILKNPNSYFKKFVGVIATCSYGMYLTHNIFIYLISIFTKGYHIPFSMLYALIFCGSFFGSLILIYALGQIPVIKDFVGIK